MTSRYMLSVTAPAADPENRKERIRGTQRPWFAVRMPELALMQSWVWMLSATLICDVSYERFAVQL